METHSAFNRESDVYSWLRAKFRKVYPNGFIHKNEARFSAGFPDLLIAAYYKEYDQYKFNQQFIEVKLVKNKKPTMHHLLSKFSQLQLKIMEAMDRNRLRTYGMLVHATENKSWIYHPRTGTIQEASVFQRWQLNPFDWITTPVSVAQAVSDTDPPSHQSSLKPGHCFALSNDSVLFETRRLETEPLPPFSDPASPE